MALNQYLTLGRSGLRVSPLCLGTMTFGLDWGWGCSPEVAASIIHAYFDAGGNFIDTANIYTKGHSEKICGDLLFRHKALRQRCVLATKFMGNMFPGDPNAGGAGRKAIIAQCNESLRRLQTDYIDLYWMHFDDPHTPIEETMSALDDLVRAGKVRYLGFSDVPAWKVTRAQCEALHRGLTPLCALQIEYSLLERTVEGDLIPMAREMGLGVTPWSPLKGGVLSGKHTRAVPGAPTRDWLTKHFHDRTFDIIDALIAIGAEVHAAPAQVALAWVQSRAGVASTILGVRTLEQLSSNIAALSIHLLPEHLARLDEVSRVPLAFPHEFLKNTVHIAQGGTTVNGTPSTVWPLAPQRPNERH